jgi:hypothetical protein
VATLADAMAESVKGERVVTAVFAGVRRYGQHEAAAMLVKGNASGTTLRPGTVATHRLFVNLVNPSADKTTCDLLDMRFTCPTSQYAAAEPVFGAIVASVRFARQPAGSGKPAAAGDGQAGAPAVGATPALRVDPWELVRYRAALLLAQKGCHVFEPLTLESGCDLAIAVPGSVLKRAAVALPASESDADCLWQVPEAQIATADVVVLLRRRNQLAAAVPVAEFRQGAKRSATGLVWEARPETVTERWAVWIDPQRACSTPLPAVEVRPGKPASPVTGSTPAPTPSTPAAPPAAG